MKKLACLLLVALLLFCFSGCEEGIPTAGSTPSTDPQEDIILLDNEQVKVTYKGIKEIDVATVGYSYLNLKIENKTETEIWVTMPYCCVGDEIVPFVIQGATPIYITPGKSMTATFGIQMFNLSIESLEDASVIEFTLKAVEKEDSTNVIWEENLKITSQK